MLLIKPLLAGTEFRFTERSGDAEGSADGLLPDEQVLQVIRLMRAMQSEKGTWLTMQLTLSASGGLDAHFNYMDEPVTVLGEPGLPADEIRAHLEAYPRPAETTPDWMRAALDQA